MTRSKTPDGCLDLGQIEARYETAREAPNWQDPNLLIEALTSSMYDVPELVTEVRRLHRIQAVLDDPTIHATHLRERALAAAREQA